MSKVISRIFGGIGNQLFCYAAARRLAIVNDAELVLDDISGFVKDFAYQRHYQLDHFNIPCRKATASERLEPFSWMRRNLLRASNRYRQFENRNYVQQEEIEYDPRLLLISPRNSLYIEGYWQSEKYFKDVEEIIREDLHIKPPIDVTNHKIAAYIRESESVAIHVRFFDQHKEEGVNNISAEYYACALKKMEKLVPGAHYFLFSDSPNDARLLIPLPDDRITNVSHNRGDENAYIDLWLMTQCNHFIIANSTFSWWGAWLANNTSKNVFAPKIEIREGKMLWGFNGLLPEEWTKL